jgi:hypothetical protein
METVRGGYVRLAFLSLTVALVSVVAAACGSGGGEDAGDAASGVGAAPEKPAASNFQKIRPTDHLYSVDEVVTAGFKQSKEYDVAGLDQATAAIYGFYGADAYKRQEYEIRFYPTHADAVQYGVPLAEESVGETAKLTEEDATWDEGVRERRECQGNVRGSHHVGKCLFPKYYDFAVLGNMVVLCQGHDVAESNTNCEQLFKILPKP